MRCVGLRDQDDWLSSRTFVLLGRQSSCGTRLERHGGSRHPAYVAVAVTAAPHHHHLSFDHTANIMFNADSCSCYNYIYNAIAGAHAWTNDQCPRARIRTRIRPNTVSCQTAAFAKSGDMLISSFPCPSTWSSTHSRLHCWLVTLMPMPARPCS